MYPSVTCNQRATGNTMLVRIAVFFLLLAVFVGLGMLNYSAAM